MATMRDLDRLALAMPQATKEVADDGRPTYLVHGKFFCFHRRPRPDATDPETGERLDDVLVFRVPDLDVKELMLADDREVFFTTPHWKGYPAVLMRIPDAQEDRPRGARRPRRRGVADARPEARRQGVAGRALGRRAGLWLRAAMPPAARRPSPSGGHAASSRRGSGRPHRPSPRVSATRAPAARLRDGRRGGTRCRPARGRRAHGAPSPSPGSSQSPGMLEYQTSPPARSPTAARTRSSERKNGAASSAVRLAEQLGEPRFGACHLLADLVVAQRLEVGVRPGVVPDLVARRRRGAGRSASPAPSTASPIAKNVPRPPWRSRCAAIGSVHGDGPSSKVRATTGAAIPRRGSITAGHRHEPTRVECESGALVREAPELGEGGAAVGRALPDPRQRGRPMSNQRMR